MRLSELLAALPDAVQAGGDPQIAAICVDSRAVRPGALFVAVPGFVSDGHRYVEQAAERGAAALLIQRDHLASTKLPPLPVAVTHNTRAALAAVAASFHGHPGRRLRVIGITGTDGKTTTAYLVNAILEAAGRSTGLFGTIEYKIGGRRFNNPGRLTTPDAIEVQALLAEMVAAGVECAILESTSHGLELHRLDSCEYDVGVFTNLTPDHLDLHQTFESYRAAKGRLFEMLDLPATKSGARYAVLNADDPSSIYLRGRTGAPAVTYGIQEPADVRATEIELRPDGAGFDVQAPGGAVHLNLPLPGLFNISNALAAVCVGLREGIDAGLIADALARFGGVPGRMERIDAGQPFTVILDYAHTGEALRKVLKTLRPLTPGRIIAVFGSAGERGHSRRSGMAEAAAELADFSILTDEDPRFEDPNAIIDEIAASLRERGRREPDDFIRILDRQEAIDEACRRARPDDLVLVAGKGHEQSIEVNGGSIAWDDRAAVQRALRAQGYNSVRSSPSY